MKTYVTWTESSEPVEWAEIRSVRSVMPNTVSPMINTLVMRDAFARAQRSEKLVSLQIEEDGVAVIAQEGGEYAHSTVSWNTIRTSPTALNPIIDAIKTVENALDAIWQRSKDEDSDTQQMKPIEKPASAKRKRRVKLKSAT